MIAPTADFSLQMPEASLPHIDIAIEDDQWQIIAEPEALIRRAIGATLDECELDFPEGAELSILLTDDISIQALNRQWRDKDRVTNVLSFPGYDVAVGEPAGPILGDIVLASGQVTREAESADVPLADHFCHLIIHGFLHLFGYDHQNDHDADIMENIERKALARLAIGDPYADA